MVDQNKPPRFVRATLYRYKFVPPNHESFWWEREELRRWLPPMSVEDSRLKDILWVEK